MIYNIKIAGPSREISAPCENDVQPEHQDERTETDSAQKTIENSPDHKATHHIHSSENVYNKTESDSVKSISDDHSESTEKHKRLSDDSEGFIPLTIDSSNPTKRIRND